MFRFTAPRQRGYQRAQLSKALRPSALPDWVWRQADQLAHELTLAFHGALASLHEVPWQDLELRIERALKERTPETIQQVIDVLPWKNFEEGFRGQLERVLYEGATEMARRSMKMDGLEAMGVKFGPVDTRAVEWARFYSAELVTQVSQETQLGLKRILTVDVLGRRHPYETMQDVKGMVGLIDRHAQAVANYREQLLRAGYSAEAVEKRVRKKADMLLKWRTETIARTESMEAVNWARRWTWAAAYEQGFISDGSHERVWLVAPDERLCPICAGLSGARASLRGLYPGGHERPPAHPNCRCTEMLVPKEGTGAPPPEAGEKRYAKDGVPYWTEPPRSLDEFHQRIYEWSSHMAEANGLPWHFPSIRSSHIPERYGGSGLFTAGKVWVSRSYADDLGRALQLGTAVGVEEASRAVAQAMSIYVHELLHASTLWYGPGWFYYREFYEALNEYLTKAILKRAVKDLGLKKLAPEWSKHIGRCWYDKWVSNLSTLLRGQCEGTSLKPTDLAFRLQGKAMSPEMVGEAWAQQLKAAHGLRATARGGADLVAEAREWMRSIPNQREVREARSRFGWIIRTLREAG